MFREIYIYSDSSDKVFRILRLSDLNTSFDTSKVTLAFLIRYILSYKCYTIYYLIAIAASTFSKYLLFNLLM